MINMAQSKTVLRIGQLKDQRVDILERLDLANRLWHTDDDVGPNKHQVIIDAVVSVLINNKKRQELSREAESRVWQTLSSLLHSPFFSLTTGQPSVVTLRPSTAQMMAETLEKAMKTTEAGRTMTTTAMTIRHVLDCCDCILHNPSLAPALTARLDVLVSVCSVLCQLAVSQCVTDTCLPTVLSQVTASLWHHHHRSQLPASQVLQLVTDKLLEGVMSLTHHAHHSRHSDPQLTATAASLQDFVLTTVFHESHQKLFKSYLDGVTKPQDDPQLPWTVSNIFNKISNHLQQHTDSEVKKPAEGTVHRGVVLHFLPAFFQHAVTVWRQKRQLSFPLLVHLTSYLGLPPHKGEEGSTPMSTVAMETDSMRVMRQLLCVVRERGVYNVAADRAEGGEQLRFFRRFLDILLLAPVSEEQCGCFEELLGLNHQILEPCLPGLLYRTCGGLAQMGGEGQTAVDSLLSGVVSTYSRLHQLSRLYDILLQLSSRSPAHPPPLTDALSLPTTRQQLSIAVNMLAHNTAMQLWGRLQGEITSLVKRLLGENDADADRQRLWASCLLFHQFLSQLRVSDWCKISSVGGRVMTLTSQLESDLVRPLLQPTQNENKSRLHTAGLLLAVCLGDIKLTLADYRSSLITLPHPMPSDLPFSLQTPKSHSKKRKKSMDPVARFLGDILVTQRLRLLQMGEEGGWEEQLGDVMVWDDDSDHQCHWDGLVSSVREDNYCAAQSHLWVCLNQSLLPALVRRHASLLAGRVVHVLSQSSPPSSSGHSCKSVARRLLEETTLMHLGVGPRTEFQHQIMCCVWQRFADDRSALPPSPLSSSPLKDVANPDLPWHNVCDSAVKRVMESVEEVLKSTDVHPLTLSSSQLTLLQVLGEIPLTLFPPGSRVLCTAALLLVLTHLDSRGGAGGGPGGDGVCRLLTGLLEASVGTSLFRGLNPCLLLSSLKSLAIKNAATENSSLGLVMKKAVAMVIGDFDSVLGLEPFVAELQKGLRKMSRLMTTKKTMDLNQHNHRVLLTLTHYALTDCHRYLKKDFFRKDVHSASQQHFESLSGAVEDVIDTYQQRHPQTLLHPALLRCFTAVAAQRCNDSAQGDKPLAEKPLQRIQFVVTALMGGDCEAQKASWRAEDLEFISCLYHHPRPLSPLLSPPLTRSLWASLLDGLCGNQVTAEETKVSGTDALRSRIAERKRRLRDGGGADVRSSKRRKLHRGNAQSVAVEETKTPALLGGGSRDREGVERRKEGGGEGSREEEEEKIVEAMTMVLTSCPGPLFAELLQHVVTRMASDVRHCALVWRRVVTCGKLTLEQRTLLQSFCVTVLERCVQVMQNANAYRHNTTVEIYVPVLQCLTAMLSQHKLLSTRGTIMSLLCATLVPLSHGGYDDFLCVVRAMCGVVHAVLVHHPHTAHALMQLCFPVASSVMKECIRRGDQKQLLANPDYIQPMTTCAEQVHRLVTLLVSVGEVGRVVATLVSDYTTTVQSLTLLPPVKKWLVSSMYACLDACDKHAMRQLRQRLPAGVRDVLHMLHSDYITYHKYTGKV